MGSTQQFCLKWNNHQSNMLSIFDQLLSSEHFVDVTLACDGLSVRAHKMVLSACSPFFQSLFIQNPCEHPIVILKDIRFVDLKALVQFMYRGEVNVSQDQLPTLLKAAEALKIKGLAEVTNESGSQKPGVPSVPPGSVGGPLGASLGGGHTHSHNGHLAKSEQAAQLAQQQPSVQAAAAVAAASPLAQSLAPAAAAAQNALVAAMQQTALKQAQAQLVQAAQAAQAAQERQNATSQSLSAASMASHESNSNASTPLRQTDSPMSQQNRKRRRKSAGSEKGSGDEGSGVESGAEDNLDETRGASDDESAGEEAEFEPSKLLEQSMTEVRQGAGHQDNNSSSSDNLTKDDIKPAINFDAATPGALASLNTQDPTAVLAFAAAAQAAQGASGGAGDSVAGPSQPTHGRLSPSACCSDTAPRSWFACVAWGSLQSESPLSL
ncbi:protein tramtrack, beta isoform-like [Varroa jacobsoni]|nr:protein tramtrack, beta isoform-like isoform X2 [Varroa destructor]XP_022652759.1 protein tramtrack, beta isoform-like isoform X2 [Varroa destructor]XP_022652760.1 protein tramtrack, beta isoform-like isoform X2 [Varroa destructor]XP_022703676.1 protein tramtrack, beta isoform-like [Varroa jacobsoni]